MVLNISVKFHSNIPYSKGITGKFFSDISRADNSLQVFGKTRVMVPIQKYVTLMLKIHIYLYLFMQQIYPHLRISCRMKFHSEYFIKYRDKALINLKISRGGPLDLYTMTIHLPSVHYSHLPILSHFTSKD